MTLLIKDLAPQYIWKNFYSLTQIPRPSKKEEKVSRFIVDFAKKLNLETMTDPMGNIIVRKPATKGMENRRGVVLQSHIDMVPQKNNDTAHNFETDPIQAYADGDWVKAKGTTLGADNGIGVAAIMGILENQEIKHGNLEALFT
ncbi:MAG: aminoacyl-histidine dipeptidase, partial [Bacteroidales bacterium]|nr:aminoacyl-histidine dipeptidase [Bacteroidales bacterium]